MAESAPVVVKVAVDDSELAELGTLSGFGVVNPTGEPSVELEPGKTYAILEDKESYRIHTVDDPTARPPRKKATPVLNTAESFVDYLEKHSTDHTEVWANLATSSVVAVIDAHEGFGGEADHGGHVATLKLEHSKAWLIWTRASGTMMSQEDFAELIESRIVDVQTPSGGELLEIAQSFQSTTKSDFGQGTRLRDGQVKFEYVETTTAKAGAKGELTIPEVFILNLKPYVGGPTYRITARLRHRTRAGEPLKLGLVLERPEDVLEAAFKDVIDVIGGTGDIAPGEERPKAILQTIYYGIK